MGNIYFSFPKELLKLHDINHKVNIVNNGICYPFNLNLKKNSKKLIIFFPGAFNRELFSEVKFQRSSYFNEIHHNCISFFDPTLFLNKDINIGWFQGELAHDYILYIESIIRNLIESIGIETEDIIFFGTSAGGIPSIRLASFFLNCTVYSGNIQTNFLKYYKGARDRVIEFSYGNLSIDEIQTKFSHKSNILNIDEKFNLIYTQNKADKFHYLNHFFPYVEKKHLKKKINFEIYEYYDEVKGHSPLGKDKELLIIEHLIEFKTLKKLYLSLGFSSVN